MVDRPILQTSPKCGEHVMSPDHHSGHTDETPVTPLNSERKGAPPLTILYTNWRGETAVRRILIDTIAYGNEALGLGFGSNEWHPEAQWLLSATDADKGERRTFAMAGIKAWGQEAVDAALVAISTPTPPHLAGDDVTTADRDPTYGEPVTTSAMNRECARIVESWQRETPFNAPQEVQHRIDYDNNVAREIARDIRARGSSAHKHAISTPNYGGGETALADLVAWADAYPKAVFPAPDYTKAHEALQAVGMTLDAISADIMRTALDEVGRRARSALSAPDHPAE